MPISRQRKEDLVAQYVELLKESQGVVITRNNGMNMANFNEIRAKLRDINSSFVVAKNTLFSIALEQLEMPVPEELLNGPVVVAFAREDVGATAKAVLGVSDDVETFEVHGALVDGEIYDEKGVDALSKLPTMPEMQAQLVSLVIAPVSGLVNVLNSGTTQVLNVVAAYAEKDSDADAEAEAA